MRVMISMMKNIFSENSRRYSKLPLIFRYQALQKLNFKVGLWTRLNRATFWAPRVAGTERPAYQCGLSLIYN